MVKNPKPPSVALIITVLNEAQSIKSLLNALKNQTLSPKEVVIVDGGSTDGTWNILELWSAKIKHLKIFQLPGANRSKARNYGVSKTHSPLIAFTDAGCIPQNNWLEELTKPFVKPEVSVVSGYYSGLAENEFQRALIPYVLVMPEQNGQKEFFPSTRSMAMTRSVWDKSGGFDPRLSHNEDYAFAVWLKKIGLYFHFAPQAIVGWIPRKNLKSTAVMFFRFSFGDIQAGILRPKIKYIFIRYMIFIYILLLCFQAPLFLIILVPLMIGYILWSIAKNARYIKDIRALFWIPVIQITADLSVMSGTLFGITTRLYGIS